MNWIMTASGRHFDLLNPTVDQISIVDITRGLSNLCRFTGQLETFYSVAQHSVLASYLVPPEHALEALLHDAQEAYVGDVSTPLKSLLPEYREIEGRLEQVVRKAFGLPAEMSDAVRHADRVMLATEREYFGMNDGTPWPILEGVEPTDKFRIVPWSPRAARSAFFNRYTELFK